MPSSIPRPIARSRPRAHAHRDTSGESSIKSHAQQYRLQIDMTHCRARGACIDFLPGTLMDDHDGYPVARSARGNLRRGVPVAASDMERARVAERNCPRRAVIITEIAPPLQG